MIMTINNHALNSTDNNNLCPQIQYHCLTPSGIFCHTDCQCSQNTHKHHKYLASYSQAMTKGYRPCQICRPYLITKNISPSFTWLLEQLHQYPDEPITASSLTMIGLTLKQVQYWFKTYYGLTFANYRKLLSINNHFNRYQQGHIAFNTLDNNKVSILEHIELSQQARTDDTTHRWQNRIQLTRLETPIGELIGAATKRGICLLEFADQRSIHTQLKAVSNYFNSQLVWEESPYFYVLKQQLNNYFSGNLTQFSVDLDLAGTQFQQTVWQQLQKITYGQCITYQQQAQAMGKPKAVRAVATANGMNRISIIIPCHRIIGSNGDLTGYAGGVWRKKYLLDLEQQNRFKDINQ
ncbi:MAG: methylated-DNA--[protein]-cysteine S-methyltransferase [Candidatus Schmidhempelia sp.]|nr:methylated-DNA--[protein]-cysteine S-methyltransferase [Candidatus Schmidhempelia sp.]